MNIASKNQTDDWTMEELEDVLKNMKTNKFKRTNSNRLVGFCEALEGQRSERNIYWSQN